MMLIKLILSLLASLSLPFSLAPPPKDGEPAPIQFTIRSVRSHYRSSNQLELDLDIQNVSKSPVTIFTYCILDHSHPTLCMQDGTKVDLYRAIQGTPKIPRSGFSSLQPGEHVKARIKWSQYWLKIPPMKGVLTLEFTFGTEYAVAHARRMGWAIDAWQGHVKSNILALQFDRKGLRATEMRPGD